MLKIPWFCFLVVEGLTGKCCANRTLVRNHARQSCTLNCVCQQRFGVRPHECSWQDCHAHRVHCQHCFTHCEASVSTKRPVLRPSCTGFTPRKISHENAVSANKSCMKTPIRLLAPPLFEKSSAPCLHKHMWNDNGTCHASAKQRCMNFQSLSV